MKGEGTTAASMALGSPRPAGRRSSESRPAEEDELVARSRIGGRCGLDGPPSHVLSTYERPKQDPTDRCCPSTVCARAKPKPQPPYIRSRPRSPEWAAKPFRRFGSGRPAACSSSAEDGALDPSSEVSDSRIEGASRRSSCCATGNVPSSSMASPRAISATSVRTSWQPSGCWRLTCRHTMTRRSPQPSKPAPWWRS